MMPHIQITPLPSVKIQPNSYGNLKKKIPADHKLCQNFNCYIWLAFSWIHSSHIQCTTFTCVNACKYENELLSLSSCLCYLLDSGTLLGSLHKIQENFYFIPSGNFRFLAVQNEFKNIHVFISIYAFSLNSAFCIFTISKLKHTP